MTCEQSAVAQKAALALPAHAPGMRIGLFGGSFDPPHEGHRLASEIALKRLGLDRVWWLVSPGNPLKDTSGLAPLAARLAAARAVIADPRIVATDLEASLGSRYSVQTVERLIARCPGVRFVWIMGADNLAIFHRWKRWRDLANLIPIAVIDRPGSTASSMSSRAGVALSRRRIDEACAKTLPLAPAPAFVFIHGLLCPASSTELRAARRISPPGRPAFPPGSKQSADR